ncbi:hypothetical protein RGQ29_017553 [Quercus rubra]|uniref:GDSL esterase/lipase At5g03610-like n=1 Tax=Quercus rubra TaxID=3512 RepID=A0AAN7FGM2_QUERU|nr:hypothetical protein RGQ29_017553 [Quercus rubra]
MDKKSNFLFLLFSIIFTETHAAKGSNRHQFGSTKLFVFGDSYVDTGNSRNPASSSWKEPYGITFPGKPTGRFSDGRVLTDYIASFSGISSPIAFERRKLVKKSKLQFGMNFACGGTGVFDTLDNGPNMTTQINFFQQQVEQEVYSKCNLNSSVALVSLAGNDYGAFLAKHVDLKDLRAFTSSIIDQLAINLERIRSLGVPKIAVTAVEPMGCLPQSTASSSYQNCSETWNLISNFHNQILQQTVQKLNGESRKSVFTILDLNSAFRSAFKSQDSAGNLKFKHPLKPCCVGVSKEYSCGSVDKTGARKYTTCKNPELSFFWDTLHPSQGGWRAVYSVLQSSLQQLY